MTPNNHSGRILIWSAIWIAALVPTIIVVTILLQYLMRGQAQLIETLLLQTHFEVLLIAGFSLTILPWYVLLVIFIQRDRTQFIRDHQQPEAKLGVSAK